MDDMRHSIHKDGNRNTRRNLYMCPVSLATINKTCLSAKKIVALANVRRYWSNSGALDMRHLASGEDSKLFRFF
jgi:hypothetical protein